MTTHDEHHLAARIQAFLDGELPAGEADEVRDHCRSCAQCRRVLDESSRVRELLSADDGVEPVRPLWPLIGFAAAVLFGFVALPLAARGSFAELTGNSAYRTMQILFVLQASLWIFGAAYAIGIWRRVTASRPLSWFSYAAILLVAVLTFLPYLVFTSEFDCPNPRWRRAVS